MKKRCLTALLLTLVLLLAVGCANDTPPADQTGGEGSVQTPAPTGEEETPGGQPDPEQPDPEGSSEAEGERAGAGRSGSPSGVSDVGRRLCPDACGFRRAGRHVHGMILAKERA